MEYGDWVVLANIGTDWPEVFGPFVNLSEAEKFEDELSADQRVFHTGLQQLIQSDTAEYFEELDEIISR